MYNTPISALLSLLMQITKTHLPDCLLIQPPVYHDNRGHFRELYVAAKYQAAGLPQAFVQDNLSSSQQGVVRGMHFQRFKPQGKLISVLHGEIYDVMLDLRPASASFGQWQGIYLDAQQAQQLWIPPGFAHGFQALSTFALVSYKTTAYYDPTDEGAFNALDPKLAITWPQPVTVMSDKDRTAPAFEVVKQQLIAVI
ncbi:MAG: dTDP-4-dehydrorhamnose 3,5-epimerase [Alishewanella sp.]|nr:dTDP-4-dehydrorhamnose 3,5-epimerase [Alishewanella sp.]MDP5187559.1 dTDP-4-dehydrorhamnose 3,5-epimerase [Alishewanella sp.]